MGISEYGEPNIFGYAVFIRSDYTIGKIYAHKCIFGNPTEINLVLKKYKRIYADI